MLQGAKPVNVLFVISTAIKPCHLILTGESGEAYAPKKKLWRDTCSRIESLEVMVVILNLCGQEGHIFRRDLRS